MKTTLLAIAAITISACGGSVVDELKPPDPRAVIEATLRHYGAVGADERPLFRRETDIERSFWADFESWPQSGQLRQGVAEAFVRNNAPGSEHEDWLGSNLGVGFITMAGFRAHFMGTASELGEVDMDAKWEDLLSGPPACTSVVSVSAPARPHRTTPSLLHRLPTHIIEHRAHAHEVRRQQLEIPVVRPVIG